MKKDIIVILMIIILSLNVACSSSQNNEEEFIKIVKNNPDGKEYFTTFPNAKIILKKEIKTNKDIPKEFVNLNEFFDEIPNTQTTFYQIKGSSDLSLIVLYDKENKTIINIAGVYFTSIK
jgi:hypothetical protein